MISKGLGNKVKYQRDRIDEENKEFYQVYSSEDKFVLQVGSGKITKDGNAIRYRITASKPVMRGIVEKGSIAIDGISLTVAEANKDWFEVSIIPHTMSETILEGKRVGEMINLENDIIGKYVERLLSFEEEEETKQSSLTKEFLLRAGF